MFRRPHQRLKNIDARRHANLGGGGLQLKLNVNDGW